ncbi:MAG: hypothetical protein AAGL49_08900 [Pseudomonadota bacterium]
MIGTFVSAVGVIILAITLFLQFKADERIAENEEALHRFSYQRALLHKIFTDAEGKELSFKELLTAYKTEATPIQNVPLRPMDMTPESMRVALVGLIEGGVVYSTGTNKFKLKSGDPNEDMISWYQHHEHVRQATQITVKTIEIESNHFSVGSLVSKLHSEYPDISDILFMQVTNDLINSGLIHRSNDNKLIHYMNLGDIEGSSNGTLSSTNQP